jgi:hypothetical protein
MKLNFFLLSITLPVLSLGQESKLNMKEFFWCSTINPESGLDQGRSTRIDPNDPSSSEEALMKALETTMDFSAWKELLKSAPNEDLSASLPAFVNTTKAELPTLLRGAYNKKLYCYLNPPPAVVTRALYKNLVKRKIFDLVDYKENSQVISAMIKDADRIRSDMYFAYKSLVFIEVLSPNHFSDFPDAAAILYGLEATFKKYAWVLDEKFTQEEHTTMIREGRRPQELALNMFFRANTAARAGQHYTQNWPSIVRDLRKK